MLRWCPAPKCSFVIKVNVRSWKQIDCHCECGYQFCFDCGEEWHGPVPCEVVKKFNDHKSDGIFRRQWLLEKPDYIERVHLEEYNFRQRVNEEAILRPLENTDLLGHDDIIKTCPNPNCAVYIEKISGGNAMVSTPAKTKENVLDNPSFCSYSYRSAQVVPLFFVGLACIASGRITRTTMCVTTSQSLMLRMD